jgi:hypothetical protein
MPPVPLAASVNPRPLAPTATLEADMVVPFCWVTLPNQVGDHRLVFIEPLANSSSRTTPVGAPRLAGASGTAPFVVPFGGVVVVVVVGGVGVVVGVVVVLADVPPSPLGAGVLTVGTDTTVVAVEVLVLVVGGVWVLLLIGTTRRNSATRCPWESPWGALNPDAPLSGPTTPISTPSVAPDRGRWENSYVVIAISRARLTQRVPWLCVSLSRGICLFDCVQARPYPPRSTTRTGDGPIAWTAANLPRMRNRAEVPRRHGRRSSPLVGPQSTLSTPRPTHRRRTHGTSASWRPRESADSSFR